MSGQAGKINPKLKLALEFGPVLLFFVGFKFFKDKTYHIGNTDYSGFVAMTAIFVVLIAASTALLWKLTGKLSKMQLMTLILVVVMGGATVWFNDPHFIKMKPTLLYLFFAGILGFGLLRGKSYLALVMEDAIPMQHEGWMILTRRLALFFVALAVANEAIWRTMTDSAWVNFKTFGLPLAMFAFFMMQARVLEQHGNDDKTS
jgi:intracellular septation protein